MKLKDPHLAPVGGWYYEFTLTREARTFPAIIRSGSFRNLIANVKKDMEINGNEIPVDLAYQIEQQICQRQPEGRCWMQTGDQVANMIHSAARLIDSVAGTTLERKAKGCKVCGKRRSVLNQMFNK